MKVLEWPVQRRGVTLLAAERQLFSSPSLRELTEFFLRISVCVAG
ncbi:hypothetical protein LJR084_007166 [Variovorax sp. LjRoot84]